MIVKIHKNQQGQVLVALCDSDILGKKFEQNNLKLDLTSSFYDGKEIEEKELDEIINKAYILNLTGKDAIKYALDKKLIKESNIIKIAEIPHAECLIVRG